MRRKWGCKLQITFLGVDHLLPNSLLVVTQPSFSSSCPECEILVVPIHSQRPPCHLLLREKTFFFVSYLILKGLLCWPQSDDFPNSGFISTPLPFIFFHSRIPPALILQGFSVPLMPCSVGLDSFPSTNTEPAKKLQATDLTLWNLLCLMLLYFILFFSAKEIVEGFLSLVFPTTFLSWNAAGATFSSSKKLFIFRVLDGAFSVALITYIKVLVFLLYGILCCQLL